jgi:hypothetical protein
MRSQIRAFRGMLSRQMSSFNDRLLATPNSVSDLQQHKQHRQAMPLG